MLSRMIADAAKAAAARKATAAVEAAPAVTVDTKVEKIKAATAQYGQVWEKYGKVRIYLDADKALALIGWDITRYGSGSVMSATKDGEKASNTAAAKAVSSMNRAFVDCLDGEVVCDNGEVKAALEKIIAAVA